jgi:hypothetical protein
MSPRKSCDSCLEHSKIKVLKMLDLEKKSAKDNINGKPSHLLRDQAAQAQFIQKSLSARSDHHLL